MLAGIPTEVNVSFTVSSSTTSGGDWLSFTPANGTTPGSVLTVTAGTSGLGLGVYRGSITITPAASRFQPAGAPVSFRVALTVTSAPLVNQVIRQAYFTPGTTSTLTNNFLITPDVLPGPFTVEVMTDSGGN
jgi:hypothetical protein